MPFTIVQCPIAGLYEIQPKVFSDNRGYFFESWSQRDFAAAGITYSFVQDNQSKSSKGVLRGLHFQKNHPQGKLVRVLSGEVFDVLLIFGRILLPTGNGMELSFLQSGKISFLFLPDSRMDFSC